MPLPQKAGLGHPRGVCGHMGGLFLLFQENDKLADLTAISEALDL